MQKRLMPIFRMITACSSILFTMTFIVVVLIESRPTWKSIQAEYREIALSQTTDAGQLDALRHYKHEIHQLELDDVDRIDRCITCHTSVTNPDFQQQPLPHRTHSGDILQNHPIERFGCTICHGGQGQAVDQKNAHARAADIHWAQPLMAMQHIQSSCGQCHLTIFTNSNEIQNTEIFQKGHEIFAREGCLGCHKARGVGGSVGPDLTEQGEKTKHEYSFANVAGEHTIANWLYEHFKDPEMVSPGSEMLAIKLDDAELAALVTFTLGMNKPDLPFDYFSVETLNEFKGQRDELAGETIYPMLCSACHGEAGEGKNYEQFKMGVPSIGNQDFLAVASLDFLEFTLAQGRRRHMEAWTPRFSGLQQNELTATALFLRHRRTIASSWQEVALLRGDQREGEILYRDNCSMCHGQDGRAAQIISISNADFLAVATDDFLYQTIRTGRGNAAMPAWGHLTSQQCADLLSHLRCWGPKTRSGSFAAHGDARAGEQLYHYRCSRCHGTYGQGDTGPMLFNR
ncbi:c-type cytochrome, partial [candidate division KSB1 bacterium]|nr:c-type cytochrome [candidate division KSB1 bacterium]